MKMRQRKNIENKDVNMSGIVKTYCFLLLIVFLAIVVYLNVFVLKRIREQEHLMETDSLANLVRIWDNMLENNTIFIENLIVNNGDVARLGVAKQHEDQVYALLDIRQTLNEYSLINYGMNEVFFYHKPLGKDGYVASYRYNVATSSHTLKAHVDTFIRTFEEEGIYKKWFIEEVDGQNYLIYLSGRGDNYAGCWCSIDYLINMVTEDHSGTRRFFVTDDQGISRTDAYMKGDIFDLASDEWYSETDQTTYRQLSMKSDATNVYFVEHVEKSEQESSILQVRNVMIIMCVILACVLILFSIYMEAFLYRPMRRLVSKMLLISEGDFESKITGKTNLREIRILNQTFNMMVDEIKKLKIAVYEEKIRKQKVRLQYLQMQIRPHFLVNALNSVYSMVDMDNFAGAKEMCRYLMQYFRFLYNQNSDLVVIAEEMEHVRTYVQIQKMRRPNRITFEYHIDEECRVCLVPPLLLQTFVENSIKYGIDAGGQNNYISITVTGDIHRTQIVIRDHGRGFLESVLDSVRQGMPVIQDGRECVGILNVVERLRLFYGEQATLVLYNDGGAVAKIEINNK